MRAAYRVLGTAWGDSRRVIPPIETATALSATFARNALTENAEPTHV